MKIVYSGVAAAAVVMASGLNWELNWGKVASALVAGFVLTLAAHWTRASGAALVVMLAGLYVVPSSLINVPEAVLFDVIKVGEAPVALAREVLTALLAASVVAWVMGQWRAPERAGAAAQPALSAVGLLWRLAAAVGTFVVCYFVVGAVIYPYVKQFYAVRQMPPMGAIVSMQVLRALALLGAAYPLVRAAESRRSGRWLLALALPAFGGLVPLLPANPFMPDTVRLVHALEIMPYYALYGWLLATWFGGSAREPVQ
jgi:hypothetical protein